MQLQEGQGEGIRLAWTKNTRFLSLFILFFLGSSILISLEFACSSNIDLLYS